METVFADPSTEISHLCKIFWPIRVILNGLNLIKVEFMKVCI